MDKVVLSKVPELEFLNIGFEDFVVGNHGTDAAEYIIPKGYSVGLTSAGELGFFDANGVEAPLVYDQTSGSPQLFNVAGDHPFLERA